MYCIFSMFFVVLSFLAVGSGCTTQSSYIPAGEKGVTSQGIDMCDYQLVVEKMVSSMLQHGLKTTEGGKPVIVLGPIYNHTHYNIEVRMIGEDIRIEVLKSALANFSTATAFAGEGSESGELYKQLEFQNESGYVEPSTAKKYGQIVGADYVLFGNIYEIQRSNDRTTEASFKFNLTLQDVRTGLAVWADTKPIRKNIPR